MIRRTIAEEAARGVLAEVRLMLRFAKAQEGTEAKRDAYRSIRDRLRNAVDAQVRYGMDRDHEDLYLCLFDATNWLTSALNPPIFNPDCRHVVLAHKRLLELHAILEPAETADVVPIGGAS
jgi:hypothetical protein